MTSMKSELTASIVWNNCLKSVFSTLQGWPSLQKGWDIASQEMAAKQWSIYQEQFLLSLSLSLPCVQLTLHCSLVFILFTANVSWPRFWSAEQPWCHDAIRTRKTANCQPTASRSYYFWRKSTEFSSNTSDWKFYRRTLFYLWQHLVLLQQRPVIGDQQAQRNDSVRRYYLPDDSRHFRSPRGFLATRLFSSIPVWGGGRRESSVQQLETLLRIL